MNRLKIAKPHNSGTWTVARFNAFIKGGLRQLSNRWGPKVVALKNARVERGIYKCAGYKKRAHKVPVSIVHNGKRIKNVTVDHILPVIDPKKGFTSWDDTISRLFVEVDGLQVLCRECHTNKTADERIKRK